MDCSKQGYQQFSWISTAAFGMQGDNATRKAMAGRVGRAINHKIGGDKDQLNWLYLSETEQLRTLLDKSSPLGVLVWSAYCIRREKADN